MTTNEPNDTDLAQTIADLDDPTAARVLQTVVKARMPAADCALEWAPDLGSALSEEFDLPPATSPAPSGELARQALLLLCQDEEYREPIRTLISGPRERAQFGLDPVTGALLITGALFALQSHIEISRAKDGRWTFKFIKKPSKDSIVGPLITKLVALISGGPPTPG